MTSRTNLGRLDHLTFKGNLAETRYGWLRLTPAFSVHLVTELLTALDEPDANVLDPFCGTGTTALVCAERGVACDTTDINPFLLWLTRTKLGHYDQAALDAFATASERVATAIMQTPQHPSWLPPIHQIEKWWPKPTVHALGRAMATIKSNDGTLPAGTSDLLYVAFCRTMIEHANVSFGHQSMSFSRNGSLPESSESAEERVSTSWVRSVASVITSAQCPVMSQPRTLHCDARHLSARLDADRYACVITSPPYPNRMSYVRELRPYMYWLGYLQDRRQAGQLDWQSIGGTWGAATSNLSTWEPENGAPVPFDGFDRILENIGCHSPLLSRYVHKYFQDMARHIAELFAVVKPGGTINYIVGNSKFYDVLLPVESIFAALFTAAGFETVNVRTLRKRTSKRELFEYLVMAQKPARFQNSPLG